MKKYNPNNERIKRQYFTFLKEAKRHSEPTVDAAAKALNRFEVFTKFRDFKAFHYKQSIAFKNHLAEQKGRQSGEKLSKATLYATLNHLKRFFSGLRFNPAISHESNMWMLSILICLTRIPVLPPRNGNKGFRPWNRSGTSFIRCHLQPR
jgi:hypothetical protein